jgi:hypothetical protein
VSFKKRLELFESVCHETAPSFFVWLLHEFSPTRLEFRTVFSCDSQAGDGLQVWDQKNPVRLNTRRQTGK